MQKLPPERRRRSRRADSRQMAFAFDDAARPFRAIVLAEIARSTGWRTAYHVAIATGLTYPQTIFALIALHNNGKISRTGCKFTARWGPLELGRPPESNFSLLQSLFNGSIRK